MPDSKLTIAEAAIDYARAGWKVLPVDARSKRPRTRHGVLDASDDPSQVLAWWREWPDAAIATPTGNGLLVIDIDPRNGGFVQDWMPKTRAARTQSGGLHLHYRINDDIKSRANLFGPGIDSKCKGGYVLIPPSPGYAWREEPLATISRDYLENFVNFELFPSGTQGGAARKHPQDWHSGMIQDQVIAWASWLALD
ncbi:MAG: bifunctional DNA primase/polymerase, partial [Pyrinomonadaceae bacterium]